MAGGAGTARGELSNEPNVVPMIDILLVLLIIFMITQPLSRMALDVQVPPAACGAGLYSATGAQRVRNSERRDGAARGAGGGRARRRHDLRLAPGAGECDLRWPAHRGKPADTRR